MQLNNAPFLFTDMPEHGEHDPASNKWFCGYWMSSEEWDDVHDYAPPERRAG
jgi:hypothetical protein